MIQFHARETLAAHKARAAHGQGVALTDHLRVAEQSAERTVVEFIGTDDFARQFVERQRYEVDAGRESEPLLYTPIYSEISDPTLPRQVTVYELGAGGVIFDEIREGGEVKFMTVGEGSYTVPIRHYAVGLEYSKDLLIYNELWRLPLVERAAGAAFNALKNHIHFAPFLNASYGAANQTAASSEGATLAEKTLRTIEAGIAHAVADEAHPRRGAYALLVSGADAFTIERALLRVPQEGFSVQSSALGRIQTVIAYDGWSGTRGNKAVSYAGVPAGTAYLISLAQRDRDHQSFEKLPLQSALGTGDITRFVLEQVVYDSYFGVYCNPIASTEEIELP